MMMMNDRLYYSMYAQQWFVVLRFIEEMDITSNRLFIHDGLCTNAMMMVINIIKKWTL